MSKCTHFLHEQCLPWCIVLPSLIGLLTSCSLPESHSQPNANGPPKGPIAVDVATAQLGSLQKNIAYVGTTAPSRTVDLRARLEGQLLALTVDAGDRVTRGQRLGRIDDDVLVTQLLEAQSELAARQSDVAQAEARIHELRTQVEESRLQWQQALKDAKRMRDLNRDGAISVQMAEQAQTAAQTAAQTMRTAQAQVQTQQQAVVAAQKRARAQEAVIAQIQERRSQALLIAPISGQVTERQSDPGNLLQVGGAVLTLGAFDPIKITVQVSELDLANIRVRQVAQVRFDAFPDRTWSGTVARIPPRADPTARQIPVEVALPNPSGRLTSGLLARVRFVGERDSEVVVPQTALQAGEGRSRTNAAAGPAQIFVLNDAVQPAQVVARPVTLGEQQDDQVEIKSGLRPGEAFVVRSARPLKDGVAVQQSILSQPTQRPRKRDD